MMKIVITLTILFFHFKQKMNKQLPHNDEKYENNNNNNINDNDNDNTIFFAVQANAEQGAQSLL